ncbi:MAG TPA: hypothetical protein VF297_22330 [Pyrinomonadaceae bacterium]
MNDSHQEEGRLRQFLLGKVSEEERQRVEERLMVDPEYREIVLAAQDELIEEYAEGSLSEDERRRVEALILSTPEQRQKLRTSLLIKKYVADGAAAHSPLADEEIERGAQRRTGTPRRWRPYAYGAVAAMLLLAFGLLVLRSGWFRGPDEESKRRRAVESELAQLNDARASGAQPAYSVPLAPVFVRDLKAAPKVSPPAGASAVELRLLLMGGEYDSYRAVIRRLDGPAGYNVANLRAAAVPGGRAILLKVPARLLTRGDYQVTLSGVGANDKVEEVGEYNFHVPD